MKPELIKYTDFAIMELVCQHMLQLNSWLRLGDRMDGPTCTVQNGKLYTPAATVPDNVIQLVSIPPSILPPPAPLIHTVTASSAKLQLDDIQNFRTSGLRVLDLKLTEPTFLHPYGIVFPNRDWLEKYDVGDEVSVQHIDSSNFAVSIIPVKLTQALIDENAVILFRYGLSKP